MGLLCCAGSQSLEIAMTIKHKQKLEELQIKDVQEYNSYSNTIIKKSEVIIAQTLKTISTV